jgi:hypothetical protein
VFARFQTGRACGWDSLGGARCHVLTAFLGFLAIFFLPGCSQTKLITDPILGPDHAATNVFRREATLPVQMRRVAVLPLTFELGARSGAAGQELLEPILHTELSKAGRFELVFVKPGELVKWTGKERWSSTDVLPSGFLNTIAERTGADGVIFPRLTHFHAYPPMVIGWRMSLVANNAAILWSAEDVFDAAEEPTANSARRFQRSHVKTSPVLEDSRSILLSPSKFGQYTARVIVQTLPSR